MVTVKIEMQIEVTARGVTNGQMQALTHAWEKVATPAIQGLLHGMGEKMWENHGFFITAKIDDKEVVK